MSSLKQCVHIHDGNKQKIGNKWKLTQQRDWEILTITGNEGFVARN